MGDMSTLALPDVARPGPASDLWIHGRAYDVIWYLALAPLLFVAMTAASAALGPKGPMLVYVASSAFLGLPHNAITWFLTMPAHSRTYYQPGVMFLPLVIAAAVLAPTVLLVGTPAFGWALTINIVIAYYHITRQHMGMIHVADGRYAQVTGDRAIHAEGYDLRAVIALIAASAITWKAAGPPMMLGLGAMQFQFTLWPVPVVVPVVLTAMLAWYAARWTYRTAARVRRGDRFPVAQAVLAGGAAINLTLASLVPNDQFFLTLALVGGFHNLQYFAFCYTHHHLRAAADPEATDLYSRLARERRWGWWFVLPVLAGLGYVALAASLPPMWNAALLNGAMISHYFVDGAIWRRKYYPRMGEFGKGRVGEAVAVVPAAAPAAEPAGAPAPSPVA